MSVRPKISIAILISAFTVIFTIPFPVKANLVLFDQTTDTIDVSGQTIIGSSSTYEARIIFTTDFNGTGSIFNEWTPTQEDKVLYAGPNSILGYNNPINERSFLTFNSPLTSGVSHHVAYVYDGSEERLYLDGQLQTFRSGSGEVGDGSGNPHIGAIFRDGVIGSSFVGYLDTLRISNIARYTTSSFVPLNGDLPADGNTLLLYNFTDQLGSSTIFDFSGNGHTGTLGVGFSGATSPTLVSGVPIPAAVWLFGSTIIGLLGMKRKNLSPLQS